MLLFLLLADMLCILLVSSSSVLNCYNAVHVWYAANAEHMNSMLIIMGDCHIEVRLCKFNRTIEKSSVCLYISVYVVHCVVNM